MVDIAPFLEKIADPIRRIVRAAKGLPLDDDVYSGLIDVKDIKERTRVSTHNIYRHTYMRTLALEGGTEEWRILKDLAEMEDHYFISEEGEQRKEAILMKRMTTDVTVQPVAIPQVETRPQYDVKGKKK